MNAANVTAPGVPVSTGTVPNGSPIPTGTAAQQQTGTMGNLFAMQMLSALDQLQGAEDAVIQVETDGSDEEELGEIADLLALLQQLFSTSAIKNQETSNEETINALEAKTKELSSLMNKLSEPLTSPGNQAQSLLAMFTQRGVSQPTAEKLVEFLTALTQTHEPVHQAGLVKMGKQAEELLQQWGVPVPKGEKGKAEDAKSSGQALLAGQAARSKEVTTTVHVSQRASLMSAAQPIRVSQALSSYQAEAGVQAKSTTSGNQQQASDLILEPDASVLTAQQNNANVQTFGQKLTVPTGGHPIHSNQFSQQVTQLFVRQMKLTQVDGVHEARLILYPQSLGQVDVKITSHNGVITAQFSAETTAGKELLDNQLPQLRAALTQQGLQVDRLEVNQQQQTGSLPFQQQQRERQQQQNSENQQNSKQDKAEFSLEALVDGSADMDKIGYSG
ncbi:flagellar hook-length control protein FliK [Brevibacillus borstelensis]|uniref:flagellar hook-length control protein FliK n=1 Tax=Brevibacillus borstelensis TaxID=45462 RepID=UPI0030BACE29